MVDDAYQREGLTLSSRFEVSPAGGFFDDRSGPNAFATTNRFFPNSYDGTVIFGVSLMSQEIRRDGGRGISAAAILAHEFGHIRQFKDGTLMRVPTPVRELHADYLAGWYMSKAGIQQRWMRPVLAAFFSMGDYEFNSPQHHGTPNQRVNAVMAGHADASARIGEAFENGKRYVA